MVDGVADNVGHVVVGELVGNLASAAHALDEIGAAQYSQVLADERLRKAETVDEFVDAAFAVGELGDKRNTDG